MKIFTRCVWGRLRGPFLISLMGLLASPVVAQRKPGEDFSKKSFEELKAALSATPSAPHVIHSLRKKGDKRAIPIFKEALSKVKEKEARQDIAVSLIELGDKEDVGWPILEQYARETIGSDMPLPVVLDAKGEIVRGEKNPVFLKWCKKRGVDPDEGFRQYFYGSQGDIRLLGLSEDSRAIPLLMKALETKNHLVVVIAAEALARLQHKEAITPLIKTAERSRPDVASAIGEALVFFDDPEAQAAAEKFVKKQHTLELRRKQAKERGPKGLLKEF